jgi:multidrug transporter EmrE-like cation transporter
VGYIKFGPKFFPMKLLGISVIECGIINVKRQVREFLAPQNDTTVDVA